MYKYKISLDKGLKMVYNYYSIGMAVFFCRIEAASRVEKLNRYSDTNLKAAFFIEVVL